MEAFMKYVVTNVHQFWVRNFRANSLSDPTVKYDFPDTGQAVQSPCGASDATNLSDLNAFYCPTDDTIYFTTTSAYNFWEGIKNQTQTPGTGDFSVALVIAHEYGHNVQHEVNPAVVKDGSPTLELEADCLAGVWANSAYYQGILEQGDISKGMVTLGQIGDSVSGPSSDPHGTAEQRQEAFLDGYNSGNPGASGPGTAGCNIG
jgi:predicted metalloprotease